MFTYKKENFKVPIKVWMEKDDYFADERLVEQTEHLAQLPFAFKHVVILSDAHAGKGCPIGTVLATKDVICPRIVGVDVNCGMCAVKTSLTEINRETLKKIIGKIRKVIPVGFKHHKPDSVQYKENLKLADGILSEHFEVV